MKEKSNIFYPLFKPGSSPLGQHTNNVSTPVSIIKKREEPSTTSQLHAEMPVGSPPRQFVPETMSARAFKDAWSPEDDAWLKENDPAQVEKLLLQKNNQPRFR